MEIGSPATLRLEDSKGPWSRDVEFAVHPQRSQRGPQIRGFGVSPNAHPNPAMQVFNLATWGLNLHVFPRLLPKQVAVVCHQHYSVDAVISQNPHAPSQLSQHSIDLKASLG